MRSYLKRCWLFMLVVGFVTAGYFLMSTSKVVRSDLTKIQEKVLLLTTPDKPPPLSHTQISHRFQRRLKILQHACRRYSKSKMFHQITATPREVTVEAHWPVMNVSMKYCPIMKTGSTTWRRVINDVRERLKTLGITQKHPHSDKEHNQSEETEDVRFLFVREPYSRLLSAYVDKLFSPNTMYWGRTGRYIIQNFRSNPSEPSLRCGHDVTFPEFVRYVIHSQKTLQHRDGHFVPTHDHCDVCNVSYNYIGHLETLGEDMAFLLNVTQLPGIHGPQSFDGHTIADNAGWVLRRMKEKIRTCMTMYEACLRLWKKWHIRGIISKTEPLPVTAEEAETISLEDFVHLAIQALNRSGSKEDRRRQKTEALTEAFASIPYEERLQVEDMLTLDFALFGFEATPESVFPSVPAQRHHNYSYFDLSQAYNGM
ncbi:carbohydrate sulfotransferase 9-like isoform X3 [Babylonia areolata]|uniref:carbohydrate sulfotransferase 9-like isoform X3 n=1 Tax=Babylonia areolata TaxID=304850 RepID=UPI003FD2E598